MLFNLKKPCKNCPFRTDEAAIRFSCIERAEEIEESAYRNGFPCHLSAFNTEDDGDEEGGFVFDDNTQHCAGALIMFLHDGAGNVPFEWLDEDEQDRVSSQLEFASPVFAGSQAFIDSYTPKEPK